MSAFTPFLIRAALERHAPPKAANPAKPEDELANLAGLAGPSALKTLKDHVYDFIVPRYELIPIKSTPTPELYWASEGAMLEDFRNWSKRRQLRFVTVYEFRDAMTELFKGTCFKFDEQRRAWWGFRFSKKD